MRIRLSPTGLMADMDLSRAPRDGKRVIIHYRNGYGSQHVVWNREHQGWVPVRFEGQAEVNASVVLDPDELYAWSLPSQDHDLPKVRSRSDRLAEAVLDLIEARFELAQAHADIPDYTGGTDDSEYTFEADERFKRASLVLEQVIDESPFGEN